MSYISDELRKRAKTDYIAKRYGEDNWLIHLADRIDEAVNGDDGEYVVHSLRYSVPRWVTLIKRAGEDTSCIVRPDVLTHERPDSLERIAQEIEEAGVDGCTDWAERIRRLAGREDER